MPKKKSQKSARLLAAEVLFRFEKTKIRLDDLSAEVYQKNNLKKEEKRLFKHLVSGVVRHLLYLDWMAAFFFKGNYKKALIKNKTILRLAFYELLFLKQVPDYAAVNEYVNLARKKSSPQFAKQVNAILRNFLRNKSLPDPVKRIKDVALQISTVYSFPIWLVKRWLSFWGADEVRLLCEAINRVPEFDLVINEAKIAASDFKALLAEKELEFSESDNFNNMITIADIQAVRDNGWFDAGYCRVQDESAAIPVSLLDIQPGDLVLDACAAPGGKYLQILSAGADGIAVDSDLKRLKKVKSNVQNNFGDKGMFVCADARALPFKEGFSKILVDAPCSGLGVIRKHPDIKWRRDFRQIIEFSKLQSDILQQAASLTAEEGRLVYSTCTLDFMENENTADTFLEKNKDDFEVQPVSDKFRGFSSGSYLRTYPHKNKMDGSFCAVFEKKSAKLLSGK